LLVRALTAVIRSTKKPSRARVFAS
jgi:hypothetical protein